MHTPKPVPAATKLPPHAVTGDESWTWRDLSLHGKVPSGTGSAVVNPNSCLVVDEAGCRALHKVRRLLPVFVCARAVGGPGESGCRAGP